MSNQNEQQKKDKMLDIINETAKDNRARGDFLAKSIFVLSGGSLTLSIEHFSNQPPCAISQLIFAWILLVLSIFLALTTIVLITRRDYVLVEKMKQNQAGASNNVTGLASAVDNWIWGLGIASLSSFIFGVVLQLLVVIDELVKLAR